MTESAGRLPFTPEKHVLTFLWFVGHQSASYRDVADHIGITISGLFDVITQVADFLISISPTINKHPNTEDKKQTAEHFYQTKKFSNVIGEQFIL